MISLLVKRVNVRVGAKVICNSKLNTLNKLPVLLTQTQNFLSIGRGSTGVRVRKNFKPYPPQSEHKEVSYFGGKLVRFDEYQHLQSGDKFEALQYRKFENNYATKLKSLNKALFDELNDHLNYFSREGIKEPIIRNKGKYSPKLNLSKSKLEFEYGDDGNIKVFRRLMGEQELLLDTNSSKFHDKTLQKIDTSSDNQTIAYLMLEKGKNSGNLYVNSLREKFNTNQICINQNTFNFYLSESGDKLFYTVLDKKLRPYKLLCYDLITRKEYTIHEEVNNQCFLDINLSRDKNYLFINANKLTQSKIHTISTKFDFNKDKPTLLKDFEDGVECFVDHFQDIFFILSNETGNFKLYTLNDSILNSVDNNESNLLKNKEELKLIENIEGKVILDVELFKDYIVLFLRTTEGSEILYYNLKTKKLDKIPLPVKLSSVTPNDNHDYNSSVIKFIYSTPLTPRTELKFNLELGKFIDFGVKYISGIKQGDYVIKREFTPSGVPITLVHKSNMKAEEGGHPCLLVNYGAYGVNLELDYRPEWMALLNKGFVLALAHIRGGGELGPNWYNSGRGLNRDQSIDDLIEAGDLLCNSGLTSKNKLIGFTWSAGAINLGAAINRRPDLFKGAVLRVPFLDPVTSLMDPLQPLTQVEKEEWGDISANLKSLKHLLTYAPYDNLPKMIRKSDPFPHTLLITAENDEIVPYWQPLKYNAKLRTVLSREHPSAHFIITVPDAGHTDYLMDPQARANILVSEIIFILKCLDNGQRLNYS